MKWLRHNRRNFALFSMIVLVLQTLAVVVASGAHAASAAADGSTVIICTAQGLKVVDLDNPDADPVPIDAHQCPLCIVGCAACAAPAVDPTQLTTVVAVMLPDERHAIIPTADDWSPQPLHIAAVANPRGPPARA